jgi:hypothetical protein
MANTIGLGVQFTASASGMTKGLSQADRLLQNLGKQAAGAASLFDRFASGSAAAAAAQQQVATDVAFLTSAFKTGQVSAEQYAQELKNITSSAQSQAALFAEGAALAERTATAEERRAAQLARLDQLLAAGAISQETYDRAVAEASGANEEAARAEQERAAAVARAAQITQQNISPQQKYDKVVEELDAHLEAGRISQETYNSALNKAANDFAKATISANKYDSAVESAGDGGTLKFNELSGVLSALPGPIGNVAGRLSGLSSAGTGLARIFGGGAGLSGGLSAIGASVAGLINPFTLGVAAVAAFGAGATAVARGLIELEDRVENLGNIADKLGVSFEFIQTLEESANRSGTSIDAVSVAFGRLQKSVLGVDEESKAAQKALAEIGVTSEQLAALSPEEQYRLIGDSLIAIEDPAKRTATAVALFGRAGADLLPFFKNLPGAASDIERLGGALSDIDRGRIDDFGAGLDALGVASSRLGELLILPFAGLGEGIAQGTAEFLGGINAIASAIGEIIAPEMDTLGNLFQVIGEVASVTARVIAGAFNLVQAALEPLGGSILPAVGAGIAFINREILVGAVAGLARFFVAASTAAIAYATSATTAAVSTAALGVAIRSALASTGIGVVVTAVGLAAGALLEWAVASDETSKKVGGVGTAAEAAAESAAEFAKQLAAEDAENLQSTQKAIEDVQGMLNSAADEALQFGEAGIKAGFEFQQQLRALQKQADVGILNGPALAQEAAKAKQAFDGQIATLREAAKLEEERIARAERATQAAIEADEKLADAFIQQQGIGAQDEATKAAETLLAITRQIDEAEAAIVEARAAGDAAAEQAATRRLAILDQAQAAAQEDVQFGFTTADAERAIADVRAEIDDTFSFENFQIAPDAFSAAQEQLAELDQQLLNKKIDPQTYEQAADAIRAGFEDALETAGKIADLNEQYAEEYANIERERLNGLNTLGPTTIQANDIRTSEGASQFLRLATGQQDPALEQRRQQLQKLDEIRREINKLGGTVEIVGAA